MNRTEWEEKKKTIAETMNESQKLAIMHGKGPMLVLAGPGSGKTFTITNRILYLIEEYHILPEQILVITFTKEAAKSMQNRFNRMTSVPMPVHFGTFHAVFYQILMKSGAFVRGARLLGEAEKRVLIFRILLKHCPGEDTDLLKEECAAVLGAFGYYKNTGNREEAAKRMPPSLKDHFSLLFATYESVTKKQKMLDFDDILYQCYHLLKENEEVRRQWQNQFRYFLIDEFQDMNPIQYDIIRLLAGKESNLFAVGDDDQSIYAFRGADPSLMKRFLADYPACRQVLLHLNYRSSPEIVKASLKVIEENKNRLPKRLEAADAFGTDIAFVSVKEFGDRKEEFAYLIKQLKEIPEEEQGETAMLFRTHLQMQLMAGELRKQEIPFLMKEKSFCLYDHFIAKDIRAYFQFARCKDRSSFYQIMNKPFRGLGRECVLNDPVSFAEMRRHILDYAPKEEQRKILAQMERLETGIRQLERLRTGLGIKFLRKGLSYDRYLYQKALGDKDKRKEWMEVLESLSEEGERFPDYEDWLLYQEMIRKKQETEMQKPVTGKAENRIHLLTMHASKGLEFRRVYLTDVNEGVYPHGRMCSPEETEEERRLFYVGMTRAKEVLEILCLREYPELPSRFLRPLL